MREAFVTPKFKRSSLKLIEQANEIVADFKSKGIQLTLRGLFYQYVRRNWIENTQRNYKNLGAILSEARLCGLLDWEAIDDLGRLPMLPGSLADVADFLEYVKGLHTAYRRDRWQGQRYYVELHVEKQATMNVLAPIADKWDVAFSFNRGYSSQTAFYDASKRFIDAARDGKECVCIYAGDHDPSGEDMVRDFSDRMYRFGARVEINKIALTMAQVEHYECPPQPAKTTDSRAEKYIAEHGAESWELDALDPLVLRDIADKAIEQLVDKKAKAKVLAQEQLDLPVIRKALERIKVVK